MVLYTPSRRRLAAATAAASIAAGLVAVPPPAAAQLTTCTLKIGREVNAFLYCRELPGVVRGSVHWTPSDDGRSLVMAMSADTTGYAAFAFSDNLQMVGNLAVVGITSQSGDTSASAYNLVGKSADAVIALPADVAESNGLSGIAAFRPSPKTLNVFWTVALSDGETADGVKGAIWSVGNPVGEAGLQRHTARESAELDFGKSAVSTISTGGVDADNGNDGDDDDDGRDAAQEDGDDDDDDDGVVTPTPAAADDSDDDSSSVCFPSDATVTLADGSAVRMDALAIGDEVAVGGGATSPVFLFSHADADAVTPFVVATGGDSVDGGREVLLTASPGHYVYVNGRLAAARTIVAGDVLRDAGGRDALPVTGVRIERRRGLWNPHTLSGELLVGGVVTSCYTTAVRVGVARAALAPVAAAWAAVGGWAGLTLPGGVAAAAEAGRKAVAAWLPRGGGVVAATA